MATLAAIIGSFLFAGYVQNVNFHDGQKTAYTTDSQRVTYTIGSHSEFEDIISTRTAAPLDIYATSTPIKWENQ